MKSWVILFNKKDLARVHSGIFCKDDCDCSDSGGNKINSYFVVFVQTPISKASHNNEYTIVGSLVSGGYSEIKLKH